MSIEDCEKLKKLLFHVSFLVYVFIMIILLFRRGHSYEGITLIEYAKNGVNLMPFKTIQMYIDAISSGSINLTSIIKNLAGNIILFIPIGIYLPFYSKKITTVKQVFIETLIIIFIVEMTQLVTMRGRFDVDDLILNTIGALIGFWIWKIGIIGKIIK